MTTKTSRKTSQSLTRRGAKAVLSKTTLATASQIATDPKKARAFLQDAGIITKSGKLSARYG